MDRAAERLIVDALHLDRPHDGVLGAAGCSGARWVRAPIDGTVTSLSDRPGWAVSIAAQREGESIVGVVHVPSQGETFTAVRGAGAWLGGTAIHCNSGVALDRAVV